jgi:hypothetical protein
MASMAGTAACAFSGPKSNTVRMAFSALLASGLLISLIHCSRVLPPISWISEAEEGGGFYFYFSLPIYFYFSFTLYF